MDITGQIPEFFVALIAQIRNGGDQVDLARETPLFPVTMTCLTAYARFMLIPDDLGGAIGVRRGIGVSRICVCSILELPSQGGYTVEEKGQRFMPFGLIATEHKQQGKGHHRQTHLHCCQPA
jgi:hypothetical protein